ncbi:MAG: DNA polymerase III subunit delta' [Lachnospiraceae bacterium]|jgi:DNA polymerase-3 subunit delta'|nr:DNA polymerase III subunit delta' [Lachnospiraceae bacterium]
MAGFKNVLGHEQAVESLQNAIMLGKVSHAYIFDGEDGAGKKTLADAFAMTLQCEKGAKDACMACHSCKQALTRNQPDIIYLRPEKDNRIGVKDVRSQIVDDVSIRPYSSRYKIYIVNHAERMAEDAQNAILKTIEEPPEYVIIILLTTNSQVLLPTIRSRCITVEVRPVSDEIVKDYLMNTLSVPEDQANICTAFAQGNVGKAARLSGTEEFQSIKQEAVSLVKRAHQMDLLEFTAAIKIVEEFRLTISDYFDILTIWYRDVLVYKATMDANKLVFQDEIYEIKKQADTSSYEGIETIIQAIETARSRVRANVKLDLVLELLFLTIKEN